VLDKARAEKQRPDHIDSKILSFSRKNEYHRVRSIGQELDVSFSTVHARLTDTLGFSLRETRWIPNMLTEELNIRTVTNSMKMSEILEQQELIHFPGIITGDESRFFLEYFRNRVRRFGDENARNGSEKELARKNTCSQSSGPQQDDGLRIGHQRMYRLIAHISARPLAYAWQVLTFQIRQESANDEFISIWIMPDLAIQGSYSNVSRAISSKECFIRHISKILHQASLIFSTP
jgi:hypothetical protein